MNKNAIRKFATEARRELISRVSQRALKYGISDKEVGNPNDDSVNGHLLSSTEKKQRAALIAQIKEKGYEQVMEEVAYTWFNRFSALRFMEVNGYLPTRVRVFTDENNAFKPQILTEAIHMELDGLDMEKVYAYKEANDDDELYKYLLITQCNALNSVLPGMFQKIADYTELLFPDNLLREGSVVQQMIELIPEEDWKDAVQIIGWLYQYYNSEKKDEVFTALNKNVKITKENIPAVTQLFTPDWIVRYMVENSLGRLWVEGHPNDELKSQWKYYLEEAEQEPDVQAQLATIREEYKALKPEDILCIDPCSGSGHILAYMFDVLVQIYEAYGVDTRTAVASIVENNIYGLDIDDRAAQLAYFAVMMKACQYDKRFLRRKVQPHVYAIVESNHVDPNVVDYFCNGDAKLKEAMDTILSELHDAKEYGSILTVTPQDWSALYDRFAEITEDINMSREAVLRELLPLVQVAEALAQKYDAVVTNPPYMGNGRFSLKLTEYARTYYSDSKNDLYSVMIERCGIMTQRGGFTALITMQSWVNAPTFKNLRKKLFSNYYFSSIINMGSKAFDEIQGEKVKNVAFIFRHQKLGKWHPMFADLTSISGENEKRLLFLKKQNLYGFAKQSDFLLHEQCLVVYKTRHIQDIYEPEQTISDVSEIRRCIATGDDNTFIRLWYEVNACSISSIDKREQNAKWFFIADGGERRRWYGNINGVLNWGHDGRDLRSFNEQTGKSTLRNLKFMFKKGLTYTYTSMGSGIFNARTIMPGMASIGVGPVIVDCKSEIQMAAFVNSVVFRWFWDIMYGKVSTFETGNVGRIAYKEGDSNLLQKNVDVAVRVAKEDWDSFEESIGFQRHPLCEGNSMASAFYKWNKACNERFNITKMAEEAMNQHFIDIYRLQDELTPEVEDKDVTVRKADLGRDIRSFISYAVGCMFGRYSLYKDGLIFAGEPYSLEAWVNKINDQPGTISHEELVRAYCNEGVIVNEMFFPDEDNIIPICDDEYFEDDIVGLFVKFVKTVYGADTLDENMKFIADALGGKGQPKEVIRNYFMNGFYTDHCKTYHKRPIYWLFDSGKKNGFKCLIYMHRYQPDTIARVRTDYVHEQQARYRTAIADLETRIVNASTSERVKLNKQLKTLNDQATEIHEYEEKIHHLADQMISIDLDDGVKVNYAKFQDVLAKIK